MVDTKPWYLSKTIWTNAVALIAMIIAYYGVNIPPEQYSAISAYIIAFLNIILRFVTKQPITR